MYTLCDICGIRSTAYLAMGTQLGASPLLLLVAHRIVSITLNLTPLRCGRHVSTPELHPKGASVALLIAFESAPRRVADSHPSM